MKHDMKRCAGWPSRPPLESAGCGARQSLASRWDSLAGIWETKKIHPAGGTGVLTCAFPGFGERTDGKRCSHPPNTGTLKLLPVRHRLEAWAPDLRGRGGGGGGWRAPADPGSTGFQPVGTTLPHSDLFIQKKCGPRALAGARPAETGGAT